MRKKIKLLHVTSSLKVGGAEVVLCDIIRKLGSEEFEHHVIYFHSGPNVQRVKTMGVKTYHVKGLVCLYDPGFFIKFFLLIKKLKPDVIHSLLWSANISSRLVSKVLNIPNVSVYHLDVYNDGLFRNSIDKITRRFSNYIVAVSDDVAKSLGKISNSGKLEVVRNGIDFEDIHNNLTCNNVKRESIGLTSENFVIGSVGRLNQQKNFPLLLKSFAKISFLKKNVRLVIVGVGELENELKKMAQVLDIEKKVIFVIGKKACNYYPIFDCFVQSSIKEGLSIALLEAMSFQLPCIVTNGPEPHPVIKDKVNGLIVRFKEPGCDMSPALCEAIMKIIDNSAFAKKVALEAKKDILTSYCVDNTVYKYKKIFCKMAQLRG